jgi:hypothetical protein
VRRDLAEGTLGSDYDRTDRADIQAKVTDAEEAAKDEVWAAYALRDLGLEDTTGIDWT